MSVEPACGCHGLGGEVNGEREATTPHGQRMIVDVAIRDASGEAGASGCKFTLFFAKDAAGQKALRDLYECSENHTPASFFGLTCYKRDGKATLQPSLDRFWWEPCTEGEKAEKLESGAGALLARQGEEVTTVADISAFEPTEAVDYVTPAATFSVCYLLRATLRAGPALMPGTEGDAKLFQLNHVRVLEPRPGDELLTKDESRLFVAVRLVDYTGTIEVRMREKAALELGDCEDRDSFVEEAKKGALRFPILASVRINIRKRADGQELNAVIVEGAEQDLTIGAALPNASMSFLGELLKALPPDDDRMVVAPASQVSVSPHAGMVVGASAAKQMPASCVLTLVAHVGKSRVDDLPGGHRIVSSNCWSIPFGTREEVAEGAPEYADNKPDTNLSSFCTMDNVQYYSLSSRQGRDPVYALLVISSVAVAAEKRTFMVDKIRIIPDKSSVASYLPLLSKLNTLSMGLECEGTNARTPPWKEDQTPYSAKKARTLSEYPSGDSLG